MQFVRIIHALRIDAPHLNAILLADLATAWEGGLVFELFIFLLIVFKSYQTRVVREWSKTLRLANIGLMQILLQDGECEPHLDLYRFSMGAPTGGVRRFYPCRVRRLHISFTNV